MTSDEYLKDRVEDQINWYGGKSEWNQRWFKRLRLVELIFASLIPFLVTYVSDETALLKVIVGSMGACIAVFSGLVALNKFQENWIEYRTTAETLKHEKYLFLTQSHPYDSEDSFHLFVNHIESLLSKENSNWARTVNDKTKEKKQD